MQAECGCNARGAAIVPALPEVLILVRRGCTFPYPPRRAMLVAGSHQPQDIMPKFAIIVGVIVALVVYVILQLLGILLQFALIAAVFGFIAGFAIFQFVSRGRSEE